MAILTKDQEEFWDILRMPYKKTCDNCKNHKYYDPDCSFICKFTYKWRKCKYHIASENSVTGSLWKWDGNTY